MIPIPKRRSAYGGKLEVEFSYSTEQWADIMAMLPKPLAHDADLDGERRELEFAACGTLDDMRSHRRLFAHGSPAKIWKKERRLILARIDKAETDGDPAALPRLRNALLLAESGVEMSTVLGKRHQGRKRGARGWYYNMVLTTWTRLGGKLITRRGEYGRAKPSGPLIDFMVAVMQPVLVDDMPGAEALRKIIKQRKMRFEATADAAPEFESTL